MQKILLISFNFPPTIGGIETYARELKLYFDDYKEIEFIHPKNKISANPFLRSISLLNFVIKTLITIRRRKFDLIHLTSFNLWILGFFYLKLHKKTKILINIWGLEFVYKNKTGFFPRLYKKIFIGNNVLHTDNFNYLVSSNASKDLMILNGFDIDKINFIKLGVSTQQINEKTVEVLNEKYFLFVGRIVERKGLSWFSNTIMPNFPEYKLKVVGPIGNQKSLKVQKLVMLII